MYLSVSLGIPFHDICQWSSAELSLYQAYFRVNPWGEERADIRNAVLASFMGNISPAKPKGGKSQFEVSDFMLFRDKPKQSAKELREQMRTMLKPR